MAQKTKLLLVVIILTGSFFAGCKKSDTITTTPVAPDTDTLTQNTYTITETSTPVKGTILMAPFGLTNPAAGELLITDEHGKVLQKKELPGSAFDFNKWTINGQTRYTYFVNDVSDYHIPIVGSYAGYLVIADSLLNEIKRVNFLPYSDTTSDFSDKHVLDVHDFILLSDDHYITETYYDKHTTNIPSYLNPDSTNKIVAPIIQEVQNGSVIWQWDGSNDTSFYANSILNNDFSSDTTEPHDYMHLNAMIIDPRDGNLVVSFRHQNQVVKIDRVSGKVLWRLGGKNSDFALTEDQVFLLQHDVSLTDDNTTLMMFDNGDPETRSQSRVVEFKLDETNKTVTGFKSFDIPEPLTQTMGSVQKFGDVYFIGGGSANYILEINYVTNQKIIEFKGNKSTYRAYKFE